MAFTHPQLRNLAPAFSGDLDLNFESGESLTEYEDGASSSYSVSIESQPKVTQRKLIPADYNELIGDLDIPDYAAQSTPYYLKNKPNYNYNTICSGLTAESLQYFQHPTKRRGRVVSGAVIRNLNSEFDELAQPSPRPVEREKDFLQLPELMYGNNRRRHQEENQHFGINHISTSETSYGSQLFLRRKPLPQPPPVLTRQISDPEQSRRTCQNRNQDDNNMSCTIA